MKTSAGRMAGQAAATELYTAPSVAAPAVHLPAPHQGNWAGRLLIVFAAYMWLETFWAVNAEYALDGAILFSKYVALFWMVSRLVRDEQGIEYFSLAHVYGCLMWGYIAWTTDVRGRFEVPQGPGVDDSNMLGFHLATGLAFAGMMFIGLSGTRRWLAFAAIPLILNAVILTASRSAMIGLVAGGLGCLLFGPAKYRVRLAGAGVLGIVLVLLLAQDDIFWQRAATIPGVSDEERPLDDAAVARIEAIKGEWKMFLDYPMGAGHRGNEVLSPQYINAAVLTGEGFRSAHTTVMAALVDHGIPGILIYLSLQLWALKKLLRLRRLARSGSSRIGIYTGAIAGGFFAYTVCGLFLNLIKAEVFIWMLGLIVAVERAAVTEQRVEGVPHGVPI
jgi:hypothetical protein